MVGAMRLGLRNEFRALACFQLPRFQKKSGSVIFEGMSIRPLSYRYPHPCWRGDVAMFTPQNSTHLIHPGTTKVPKS